MIDVAKHLEKQFSWEDYTCFHFIRDIWLEETGVDIGVYFPANDSLKAWAYAFRDNNGKIIGKVVHETPEPVDPCIVLFRNRSIMPHFGIYVGGKVLHLPKDSTAQYDELDKVTLDYGATGTPTTARFFR